MLRIGDFSKLSRISIQMLRHYNEIGLLIPTQVDDINGYRYYSEKQLPIASRIQSLKDMGFGLSAIKEIITKYQDAEHFKNYLVEQLQQQKEEKMRLQQQILLIENTIHSLNEQDEVLEYSISVKEIPRLSIMSYREPIRAYHQEGELWAKLFAEMGQQKVRFSNPTYQIAVFHDESFMEEAIDVEVQCAVLGEYHNSGLVTFKIREPIVVASLTYQGEYSKLWDINAKMANWIVANGYEIFGVAFNIYHRSPHSEKESQNMVTEVCYPIAKKQS